MAVLAYHKIDPRIEWGITRITPGQFQIHLNLFRELGIKPCSLGEYLQSGGDNCVALTFDDAYESFFQFAYPALRDYNLTFTLFPVVGFIGTWNRWEVNLGWRRFRHLRWEQLREMEGAEIGSHTQTHPCLTGLNETELRRELETSKKTLEDALGREVKYLSLPFGRFNQKVLETARNLGYSAVCTMEPGADRDGFLIGRYGVYLLDTRLDILSKLGRGGNPRWEKIKLQIINRLSAGTVMVKRWRKGR